MNFRFSNLLGAPYRGGNLLIHENELLTPVGNRVTQVGSGRVGRRLDRLAAELLDSEEMQGAEGPAGPCCQGMAAACCGVPLLTDSSCSAAK